MSMVRGRARSTSTILAIRPGRGRHGHHPVGEQNGLGDVVRHEHDGLLVGVPDAQELEAQLLARHGIERGERLVHEQDATGCGSSARQIDTRCCMPPESSRG